MAKTHPSSYYQENNMTNKSEEITKEAAPVNQGVKPEVPETPKYKKEELLAIFDEMIFSGEYIEELSLRAGKLKLSFRSRSVEDTVAITKDIDGKNFSLISTLQEHRALLNLAYSLVSYAGKDLKGMTIEDRTKFIGKLPSPVAGLISIELSKFDNKISAACEEGEANF